MRHLFSIVLILLPLTVQAEKLTITYEVNPQIYIGSHDYASLVINNDGSAVWIGDLPSPINNNEYDWEEFHKQSKNHMHEIQYTKQQYQEILDLVLSVLSNVRPNNAQLGGKDFTSFNIMLWGNPNIEFRFNSIGGNDFPEGINKLNSYIKSLSAPKKLTKPDA
ncbi:hypothetical protein [Aurantivibrio plasticivorans]